MPKANDRQWGVQGDHRAAFTLIELLVVVAIISVLAAMLMPALTKARARALQITCMGNLKQLGIGNQLYMDDYEDWLPTHNGHFGVAPEASPWFSVGAPPIPSDWFTYWPDDVRWCPTVEPSSQAPPGGTYSWAPRTDYNRYLAFGYTSPMINNDSTLWMMGATASVYTSVYGLEYRHHDFVKPHRISYGKSNHDGSSQLYYGRRWNMRGTKPMLADMQVTHGSAARAVNAHSYGPAKRTAWRNPMGSNSLWEDGHVEWHGWRGSRAATCQDYRAVATRYNGHREGWTKEYPSINYWYWAKEAQ